MPTENNRSEKRKTNRPHGNDPVGRFYIESTFKSAFVSGVHSYQPGGYAMQKILSVLLFFCLFTPTGQTTSYAAPLDTTPPTITAFSLPAASSSLTVNITSLSTTDDVGVTAYCLREADSSAGCDWSVTVPTGYLFTAGGYRTLYAFVRDAAGNVSNSASAYTTVTLTSATPASHRRERLRGRERTLKSCFRLIAAVKGETKDEIITSDDFAGNTGLEQPALTQDALEPSDA